MYIHRVQRHMERAFGNFSVVCFNEMKQIYEIIYIYEAHDKRSKVMALRGCALLLNNIFNIYTGAISHYQSFWSKFHILCFQTFL